MSNVIYFKSNVNRSSVKKQDFIYLIQFLIDYIISKLLARFHILQKLKHEFLVLIVIPRIRWWLVNAIIIRKFKNALKSCEEISEQKANKYLLLDVGRKLHYEVFVLFICEASEFIRFPSVIEMNFYFFLEAKVNVFLSIEVFKSSKESW